VHRAAVASAVHGKVQRRQRDRWALENQGASQGAPAAEAAPAATPPAATDDVLAQLERLGKLRDGGVLTEDEFAAQKARLLG
jgi:hypothetical protein